ncbi:hypothetical protein AHAS_Ahas16G0204100 [Arachis hypogaea]
MDGHLEQIRRNLELSNIEDEDKFVGEKVEEQEKEAPVSIENSIKNEVVEVFEPEIPYPQKIIRVIEDQEDSLPKDSIEKDTEEREESNQGNPHSSETKNCIEEGFIEPSIQKVFDKDNAPIITQQPYLEIQEVKTTNKNTEERIVTKLQLIISRKRKRSTTSNPTPEPPASKLNQAINKR